MAKVHTLVRPYRKSKQRLCLLIEYIQTELYRDGEGDVTPIKEWDNGTLERIADAMSLVGLDVVTREVKP